MRAMILAAGLGTRLQPLTNTVSKPMIPMMGRPCMEHIVLHLRESGFTNIIANLHYLPDQVKEHFQTGHHLGVDMFYSVEKELLGTAGGMKKVETFFGEGDLLVISGDALTDINLKEFYRQHIYSGAVASLALKKVGDPSNYGVVVKGEGSRIKSFQEKPSPKEAISNLANTGIYLFKTEIFKYIPENTFFDFARDVFPLLLEEKVPMMGYNMERYWCDIGGIEAYREAHYDMLMGIVGVNIPSKSFAQHVYVGENAKIHPETEIHGPIYIGDNCVIEKGACLYGPVSLGSESIVREGAFIKRGIFWSGVEVGASSYLKDVIVGAGCQVPEGSYMDGEVLESVGLPSYREVAATDERP
jgi:mannose-1-phosphate guanylyltransferase